MTLIYRIDARMMQDYTDSPRAVRETFPRASADIKYTATGCCLRCLPLRESPVVCLANLGWKLVCASLKIADMRACKLHLEHRSRTSGRTVTVHSADHIAIELSMSTLHGSGMHIPQRRNT